MKKLVVTICLLFAAQVFLIAHEFWIKPSKFFLAKNESVDLTAMVGEGYEGEPWGGGERRLVTFDHFFGKEKESLLDQASQSDDGVAISPAKFESEGTHMLIFGTNNSYIELEPDKFYDYLKDDGMENAIEYRVKNGEENKISRELYRRSAKVLLQVGEKPTSVKEFASGLILDIVPGTNPYELRKAGQMTFAVNYQRKPLANALVRCWKKVNGTTSVAMERTDKKGATT
jgi:uncharacterized GH25 family protein